MVSKYIKRNSFFGFTIGFISACLVLSGLPMLKKLASLPGFADNTKSVRLVCWIMTMPANHQEKAIHVKATWGSRCDVLLFMSTEEGKKLNNSQVNIYLWYSMDYFMSHRQRSSCNKPSDERRIAEYPLGKN